MSMSKYDEKKAARKQQNERDFKFGTKTGKALTTKQYVYWLLAADLSGIDEATIKALLFAIEAFYKYWGPAGSFYKEFPRPGTPGKMDPHLCASAIIDLFREENHYLLAEFLSHKEVRHRINHVLGEDGDYEKTKEAIMKLTPKQVSDIFEHTRKMTAGVAVPVFYYREEGEELYVSNARYLDHPQNLPEAQARLATGNTTNRPWSVLPEHQDAYDVLLHEWEAKKQKEAEDREKYAENWDEYEPEELKKLFGARANLPPKPAN